MIVLEVLIMFARACVVYALIFGAFGYFIYRFTNIFDDAEKYSDHDEPKP